MNRYAMYFRDNLTQNWFGFGACFSEKSAKRMCAEFMWFAQNEEDQVKYAGYVVYENDEYIQELPWNTNRVLTISFDEANNLLNEL